MRLEPTSKALECQRLLGKRIEERDASTIQPSHETPGDLINLIGNQGNSAVMIGGITQVWRLFFFLAPIFNS